MTALSVNINKVATLRNARGGAMPNLLEVTKDLHERKRNRKAKRN